MEKFMALPDQKRKAIIDAALLMFGRAGYKKASINDIATKAGFSKSILFHYFGNKKSLYLYLIEYSSTIIMDSLDKLKASFSDDFFERILGGTRVKLELIKRHPFIGSFLTSAYLETDDEVKAEVKAFWKKGEIFRNEFTLKDLDTSRFKESVKPELVLEILIKYSEGCVGSISNFKDIDLEHVEAQFTECVLMMRDNFYKEEYLNERS